MLDDLFEGLGHRGRRHHDKHDHHSGYGRSSHDHDHDHYDRGHHGHGHLVGTLVRMVPLPLLLIGGFVVLAILGGVLVLCLPLLKAAWAYINTNGLKGIMDAITPTINQIWQGSGQG